MSLAHAVAAMGPGVLTEDALRLHVFPLFSNTLAVPGIYLANHSLGRPLDQTEDDLQEGFQLWQTRLGDAWGPWLEEEQAHRSRLAQLIGASRSDCIVPKTSAGQGLRTVLNALPGVPRVVSTTGEFDSVDVILKQYAALGRITLQSVTCETPEGGIDLSQLMQKIRDGVDLVVISQVMFMTGQVVPNLDLLAQHCHEAGARLLVDAYHAVGVFPIDVATMTADFMIGGSYKYLRGGPGAAFLYLSPDALSSGLQPIDIGWFAKDQPFLYERPDPPRFARDGDAFLESTPPGSDLLSGSRGPAVRSTDGCRQNPGVLHGSSQPSETISCGLWYRSSGRGQWTRGILDNRKWCGGVACRSTRTQWHHDRCTQQMA